ncbi:oxidoreductase [Mycolicibacterium aichiense]|uniref:Oxidoreductase n=2 Tax=Mycolicibacterium TaxID=1866885 RepID=A0AAD1HM23_9MYCO|nr:oxidoreductase [Mycolicibacterium aichiense]MCV7017676.1 oxidoreductase [Mycolicibacterium aichiense]BBX06713.1 oxidoreductase [Mycolicibacterium aichiense]STZ23950.1 oxidoreductase ydbC [Mycolicibacterium aichiense]
MTRFPLAGYDVHRVGFGAMQLPGPGVFGPPRDHDQALAVLRHAVDAGVDHIDTSQFYGPNVANELIREALHPYPGNLALVSKVGARRDDQGDWLPYNQPHELRAGIEENLTTLGVDRLAAVNLRVMENEADALFTDQLGAMITARDEGLIAGVGLSNVTHEQLLHALELTDIVCVQNPFNLVDRSSQPVLDECVARGIAFVPFFPLGSAFHEVNPVLSHPLITGAAERLGHTPAQIALAWTLGVADNVLLIPGTSSLDHLEENLAVAGIELDEQTQRELTAVA